MADEFKLDPSILEKFRTSVDVSTDKMRNLNSLVQDFVNNFSKVKDLSFSEILTQVKQITDELKSQEPSINAAVIIENKRKILMNQILLTNKDLTKESRDQLVVENQKLTNQNKLLVSGFQLEDIAKIQLKISEDQIKARGGEIIKMNDLNAAARKRVQLEEDKAKAAEKWVRTSKGELIQVKEEEVKKPSKKELLTSAVGGLATKAAGAIGLGSAASALSSGNPFAAGIAALGAIGKKMLDAHDLTNKLNARVEQTTMHWTGMDDKLLNVKNKIRDISNGFKQSLDISAEYIMKLAQAGVSWDRVNRFSEEFLAREVLTGQSIDSQLSTTKELTNELRMTGAQSSEFLNSLLQIQQSLPNSFLSIDQIKDDILSMTDNMKMFGGSTLNVIGMYKILMRDSDALAKQGLGPLAKLPMEYRKGLIETATKIPSQMPVGWKIKIGMDLVDKAVSTQVKQKPGESEESFEERQETYRKQILGVKKNEGISLPAYEHYFEQLVSNTKGKSPEQGLITILKATVNTIRDSVLKSGGDTHTLIEKTRVLMQSMGVFDEKYVLALAPEIIKGLNPALNALSALVAKEKKEKEKEQKTKPKTPEELLIDYLQKGKDVAAALVPSLEKLELWATNNAQILMEQIEENTRTKEIERPETPYAAVRGYYNLGGELGSVQSSGFTLPVLQRGYKKMSYADAAATTAWRKEIAPEGELEADPLKLLNKFSAQSTKASQLLERLRSLTSAGRIPSQMKVLGITGTQEQQRTLLTSLGQKLYQEFQEALITGNKKNFDDVADKILKIFEKVNNVEGAVNKIPIPPRSSSIEVTPKTK